MSNSLKYELTRISFSGISNDTVKQQYKKEIEDFTFWAKKYYKIRMIEDFSKKAITKEDLVQAYSDYLQKNGKAWKYKNRKKKELSPSTIHTYLAPICKGLDISMDQIEKPIRSAGSITKTRDNQKNFRGKKDMQRADAARILEAQRRIGIRKSELIRLRGRNLTIDYAGNLCVEVEKGKGGKRQLQRILPEDEVFVSTLFADKDPDQKIFSKKEIRSIRNIDLHSIRAQHAREAYEYYVREIESGREEEIKQDLIETFKEYHKKGKNYDRQLDRFIQDMEASGGRYILRGDNRIRARELGRPMEFNRIALMAVSVYQLSHWRLDVSARHYML